MESPLGNDPLWFKNAVIYQVHVRTFFDSNADGVGDFAGLTQKLDYIASLGVTALWVMPFYPSPLRDEGYDIADYLGVNPAYGTIEEVQALVKEAHARGLRVITELVINHTSDAHPWFQRARGSAPGTVERDFYVWSDTAEEYADARVIFLDTEPSNWAWDDQAGAYYWHRFYAHQPDLNFDNPAVQEAVFEVLEYWIGLGVDGFRLDAIPYLYEREGTTGENLPETHAFLKALRARVDALNPNVVFLAEANQWPEDTRPYFGDGDECHMNYNFPVMPRLYMALAREDRAPLVDILEQTPPIPDNCQWAMFLRNHDELTLEMVTEEERDYMWRTYAPNPRARINLGIRRRLYPLLQRDRRRMELLNALLLSMPGTPVLYYGDEIGMGDNIYLNDRDGVRTPMQWSAELNAGFSEAEPRKLYLPVIADPEYRPEAVNVAAQEGVPNSLLNWTRRIIRTRNAHPVFGRGDITFLQPENQRILAFVRSDGEEQVLVVANLSASAQAVDLDLEAYAGSSPVDLFGYSVFPSVRESAYPLTIGPYGYYWLQLSPMRPAVEGEATPGGEHVPTVTVTSNWRMTVHDTRARQALEYAIAQVLPTRRWFGAKARRIISVRINDIVEVPVEGATMAVVLTTVRYAEGEPDDYLLPLQFMPADAEHPMIRLQAPDGDPIGIIVDATYDTKAMCVLLQLIDSEARVSGTNGRIHGIRTEAFDALRGTDELAVQRLGVEQSNTSLLYGDRLILKLFRRAAPGLNPDWELGRFLTEEAHFDHVPATAGALEYVDQDGITRTLGLLQQRVANEGDAWHHAKALLAAYLDGVRANEEGDLGLSLSMAAMLGRRTAELHLALASGTEPDLAPRPFTPYYQRSLYQTTRQDMRHALSLLRRRRPQLDGQAARDADYLLGLGQGVYAPLAPIKDVRIRARRIRIHGDYHLGQVLWTGNDFVVIDFEGEPAKALSERRMTTSPLKDVAGMVRSFDYAARVGLDDFVAAAGIPADDPVLPLLEAAADDWSARVREGFVNAYRDGAQDALLPEGWTASEVLLGNFMLQKAAYEVAYELNHRPGWVGVPLRGLLDELDALEDLESRTDELR